MAKSLIDVHTMGIKTAAELVTQCGYNVIIASEKVEEAILKIDSLNGQKVFVEWINDNKITNFGFSYRLDSSDAIKIFGKLIAVLKNNGLYESSGAIIKDIHFSGLKEACDAIDKEYKYRVKTFRGGESSEETLLMMGMPSDRIPESIISGCMYDKELLSFGRDIIKSGSYMYQKPLNLPRYAEYGKENDTIELRLYNNFKYGSNPVIRSHYGPYEPQLSREENLKIFYNGCKKLGDDGYLDVLSIGSSQLSQSNFGENWQNKPNGGGVPVNSPREFSEVWQKARPMLVRTYSGTKNLLQLSQVYEEYLHISWHALSIWWFDELDGRGKNSLYSNIREHIETIRYIATTGKPYEANVPHHFAFRGCDDVTYIVSAYIGAVVAKKCGIKTFVLQNMLNTPRNTWGIQDLAKARAMIKLIKNLQDDSFRVVLQTRAGLNYFKPNLDESKIQLAAVTAMMDDIDPSNMYSPEIIHVVNYCEALFLATPEIINDSIKITREALKEYRIRKRNGYDARINEDWINKKEKQLEEDSIKLIRAMESNIADLYTVEGLYLAFIGGWLPVPDLWNNSDEFLLAKCWITKFKDGGIVLAKDNGVMTIDERIHRCVSNTKEAKYIKKHL